jgi:hypothetical protein
MNVAKRARHGVPAIASLVDLSLYVKRDVS